MEVLRDFAPLINPPTRSSALPPGAFEPAAAASTRRILLSGLSSSNPLPPLTVRLLHGRLLRLDLLADLSHILLRALSSSGLHLHALCLHSLFPAPSHVTLPFALKSASRLPNPLPVGEQLHARSLKLPSHSNPHVLTSLLDLYAKCGLLDHARGVFDEMRCPDTVSWRVLISAYLNAGRDREAVATARDAFASGMRLNYSTAVRVLTACAQAMDLDTGEAVWRAAEQEGIASSVFVETALVDLYLKCGEMAKAREVFDKMPRKDAVAWGAMVGGYASNGHPREAMELFFAMRTQGVRPDCCTVADALSACTRLGELDLGRQAAGVVDWDEFLDNPVLGTALIDMYVECGSTLDAWFVFQQMRKKDIIVWNTMVLGLGMTGHGKTALALVGQMEKSGLKLNDNAFIGILCSCVHTGLVKDGRRYFHNMIQLHRIIPQIEHYGCMVDLLSHAGLLQEAHQLIGDMPMQANVVVWRALLGGCKIHRDAELAEHVLKQLILLEPLNSENYVMLLNIYSNNDRWEDAAKLRLDMKAKGVEKVPCPFRGQPTAWPLLQEVLARADEEQVWAAGQKSVLRTRARRDSSELHQEVNVGAERLGAGGVENCYIFNSRLQDHAQKAGLMTPEYQTLKEGPSHEQIFKSTVVINSAKHESLPGFFSRKAAEQSAAEITLMEIGKSVALPTNASIPAAEETGMCKYLLHLYAQRMNYAIPSYICDKQASEAGPFICTVEIGGIQYIGATACTKIEAEIKAARTALLAIQGQSKGCANGTTKLLKAKEGGFKKQRNKKKSIEQNGEAFNVKKDGQLLRRGVGRFVRADTWVEFSGVENGYVFKSRLHEYAKKAGLMTPEYQTLNEGPSYERTFKSMVVINNAKYESLPGFFNRKDAEQSAAEVALMEIGKSVALPTNQETGLCMHLLLQYAQKMKYTIPSYICNTQASGVGPFICTVEIGGIQYIGAPARSKKEAKIKAARTALLAIQGKSEGCANGTTKYIVVPGKRQGKEREKKAIERRGVGRFLRAYRWVVKFTKSLMNWSWK